MYDYFFDLSAHEDRRLSLFADFVSPDLSGEIAAHELLYSDLSPEQEALLEEMKSW